MTGVAVRDLVVDYGTPGGIAHALRGVSFDVAPGSMLGLVGESGSGKSTVAFALMGLLAPNATVVAGTAQINDTAFDLAVPAQTRALRQNAAMIFQDPMLSLNPVFTIRAHLAEVLRNRSPQLDTKTVSMMAEDALSRVNLSNPKQRLAQYPHELSGGMRQRVVIAMALLAKPALLIADEPTTALDVTVEAQVMRQICTLRDTLGCAVLLITHSLGLVTQYCDDLAVLYAGEKLESGPVAAVQATPGHPYARMLLNCEIGLDHPRGINARDTRFAVIPGDLPDPRVVSPGCIFAPRCDVVFDACRTTTPPPCPASAALHHTARCLRLAAP